MFFPQFNFDTIIITEILKRSIPNIFSTIKHDCIVLNNHKNKAIFLKDSVTSGFESRQFYYELWKLYGSKPSFESLLKEVSSIYRGDKSFIRISHSDDLYGGFPPMKVLQGQIPSNNQRFSNSRGQAILKLRSFVHPLACPYFSFRFP